MFCKNCGTENQDTDNYCKHCGEYLKPIPAYEQEDKPEDTVEEGSGVAAPATTAAEDEPDKSVEPDLPVVPQVVESQEEPKPELAAASKPASSSDSIISMICGIVSVVMCCSSIVGVVCGIAAIVLARREKAAGRENTYVQIGYVCGIIGLILSAVALVVSILGALFGFVTSIVTAAF